MRIDISVEFSRVSTIPNINVISFLSYIQIQKPTIRSFLVKRIINFLSYSSRTADISAYRIATRIFIRIDDDKKIRYEGHHSTHHLPVTKAVTTLVCQYTSIL
jgi:hypothetical protein